MAAALLRDAAMIDRSLTGLPPARIGAKIGGKPLCITQASNVADYRDSARSHGVEAGQRHQAADRRILEGMQRDIRFDHRQRFLDLVNKTEVVLDGAHPPAIFASSAICAR